MICPPTRARSETNKGAYLTAALLTLMVLGCGQTPVNQNNASPLCRPNQCQISGSLRADNSCEYVNKADGTGCDDNNSCTLFDTCKAGICRGGTQLKDGAACDDKNVCTQTDICQKGLCIGTNPLVCPAGDACHQGGTCDPVKGCTLVSFGPCVAGLTAVTVLGCVQSDFYAPISIGGQDFSMLIDSGSTTTAVASAQCANCKVTPTYAPGSGAQDQGRQAQAAYGDGTGWKGQVLQDSLVLGTNQSPVAPMTAMRFAMITQDTNPTSPFFTGSTCGASANKNAYQGILGLGPTDLALNYTDSFLDKAAATGKVLYDAFAVNFCDVGGRMWVGGFNPTAVTQAPNFTPMVTKNIEGYYYSVAIDDLLVGSTSVGLSTDVLGPAIVDTGTRAFTMKQAAYTATTALIAASPGFKKHFKQSFFTDNFCVPAIDGSDAATVNADLPTLTLTMPQGGVLGALPVTMDAVKSYLQPQQKGSEVIYCSTLGIGDNVIWGSALMREQVIIFDRENEQVGFAPQRGCGQDIPYAPSGP